MATPSFTPGFHALPTNAASPTAAYGGLNPSYDIVNGVLYFNGRSGDANEAVSEGSAPLDSATLTAAENAWDALWGTPKVAASMPAAPIVAPTAPAAIAPTTAVRTSPVTATAAPGSSSEAPPVTSAAGVVPLAGATPAATPAAAPSGTPTPTTTGTTGTGLADASGVDPTLAALLNAIGGGSAAGSSGASGNPEYSLPPSTILPDSSTTSTTAAASPSTTDLLIIGIIGSLIAAAIYFIVFKKVRNLKELEKAV